jgi:hypothetical protein
MEKTKLILTQSMIKEFKDYMDGNQCGLIFEEKYIKKNYELFKSSSGVQQLGNYFEFLCIGANTKSNNEAPKPEYNKDGKTLTAAYQRIPKQVENFKTFMRFNGIKIKSVQDKLTVGETTIDLVNKDNGEVSQYTLDGFEGTTDIICEATQDIKGLFEIKDIIDGKEKVVGTEERVIINKGEEFISDIKYTGLIYDRFSPYGWDLNTLSYKEKLIRQPIHYKYISKLLYGKTYKFMFLLFSNTNDYDYKTLIFEVDEEEHFKEHEEFMVWSDRWIKYNLKKGFKAVPEYERCMDCPLKATCKHFEAVPKIKVFYYQPQKV